MKPAIFIPLLSAFMGIHGSSPSMATEAPVPTTNWRAGAAKLWDYIKDKCSLQDIVRPAVMNESVPITLAMHFYRFYEINNREESFSVLADVTVSWRHPCVSWGGDDDPETSQWASITQLSVKPDSIWLPVIQHMNSVAEIYDLARYPQISSEIVRINS